MLAHMEDSVNRQSTALLVMGSEEIMVKPVWTVIHQAK